MSELYLMTTVIERRELPRFVALYQGGGIRTSFISLGRGTFTGGSEGYAFHREGQQVFQLLDFSHVF